MGSLKDELAKHFPEQAKPKKRRKKSNRKGKGKGKDTAVSAADNEADWKNGVRPLKKGQGHSHPVQKKKTIRKGAGIANRKKKAANPSIPPQRLHEIYSGKTGKAKKPAAEKAKRPERRRPAPSALPETLTHASLCRESEFKAPAAWVHKGRDLQPHPSNGRVLPIRMGIDFGTAYTKIALRVADTVFFVDWDGVRASEHRYILPGECSIEANGTALLGRSPDAHGMLNNLKSPFLFERDPNPQELAAAAVFLALSMRYSRAWLYQHHAQLLNNRRLAWEVNVGLPTSSWESTSIFETYRQVGLWAWRLSQCETISIEHALQLFKMPSETAEQVGLDELNPIPEFAAQVSGYVQSPQRQNGLHLLFDVGAGTVDIASFNVHKDPPTGNNVFPIFSNRVESFGTHILMGWRLNELGLQLEQWDDLHRIPTSSELAEHLNVDPAWVSELDADFAEEIKIAARAVLRESKHDRYALAEVWESGLRTFLSGGGAMCAVYSDGLRRAFREHGTPLLETSLPKLAGLSFKADPSMFHRLSVAYGLTYDKETIGRVRAREDVDDLGIKELQKRKQPDHEDFYTD